MRPIAKGDCQIPLDIISRDRRAPAAALYIYIYIYIPLSLLP